VRPGMTAAKKPGISTGLRLSCERFDPLYAASSATAASSPSASESASAFTFGLDSVSALAPRRGSWRAGFRFLDGFGFGHVLHDGDFHANSRSSAAS